MTIFCKIAIIKVSNMRKLVDPMETTRLEDLEFRREELGKMLFKLSGMVFEDEITKRIVMKGIADEYQKVKELIEKGKE